MQGGRGGCGLWLLGGIALLGLVAFGAWAYRAAGRTSTIAQTWPSGSPGEAYATIDHTAPWSEPWTKLCRIDATTHAERWCRSVPEGSHVQDVTVTADDVVVQLDTVPWPLDPLTGANR